MSTSSAAASPAATAATTKALKTAGEEAWKRAEKVNGELFVLTYGAIVAQLCRDCGPEGISGVNAELFKMGYNIGCRLIEDFLAKSSWPRCRTFSESVQVLASVAFKMFLNCTPTVHDAGQADSEFFLVFGADGSGSGSGDEGQQMPLLEFVSVSEELSAAGLKYLNILPGVIKGAFEMVINWSGQIHMDVECELMENVKIRIKFNRLIEESLPPGE